MKEKVNNVLAEQCIQHAHTLITMLDFDGSISLNTSEEWREETAGCIRRAAFILTSKAAEVIEHEQTQLKPRE